MTTLRTRNQPGFSVDSVPHKLLNTEFTKPVWPLC